MGRSLTPKYRVEMKCVGKNIRHTNTAWYVRSFPSRGIHGLGLPTAKNLAAWVDKFHESLKPGECNHHLGTDSILHYACIRENCADGRIVAEWKAPMFMVV